MFENLLTKKRTMLKRFGLFATIFMFLFAMNSCSDDNDNDLITYTITGNPNDIELGMVYGSGEYIEGDEVKMEAVPEENCHFIVWTEDGEEVHAEAVYEFTATRDRELIAHFAHEDDPAMGYFSMNVTGDMEGSFEGSAVFGHEENPETGQDVFGIMLFAPGDDINLSFMKGGADSPDTGTIDIGDFDWEDFAGEFFFSEDEFLASLFEIMPEAMKLFFSDGGTIAFEQSTAELLEGSFEFSATGIRTDMPLVELEIDVSGSFSAVGGDFDFPDPF